MASITPPKLPTVFHSNSVVHTTTKPLPYSRSQKQLLRTTWKRDRQLSARVWREIQEPSGELRAIKAVPKMADASGLETWMRLDVGFLRAWCD